VNRIDPDGRLDGPSTTITVTAQLSLLDFIPPDPYGSPSYTVTIDGVQIAGMYVGPSLDYIRQGLATVNAGLATPAAQAYRSVQRATNAVEDVVGCKEFLNAVLADLSKNYAGFKDMTATDLVKPLTKPGTIENNASANGHLFANAYTEDGVIHLRESAYTPYLYATLIHETFHLVGPDTDKFHSDMLQAMKKNSPNKGTFAGVESRTSYIAQNCGGL
jgi:hypothetical protein